MPSNISRYRKNPKGKGRSFSGKGGKQLESFDISYYRVNIALKITWNSPKSLDLIHIFNGQMFSYMFVYDGWTSLASPKVGFLQENKICQILSYKYVWKRK